MKTICDIGIHLRHIGNSHEMMLNDQDNLRVAEDIIDVIMVIHQLVKQVYIREVIRFDHDALHCEICSLFLLSLKTNASMDPRGWDSDVMLVGRRWGSRAGRR
jgi:hypothetical protein